MSQVTEAFTGDLDLGAPATETDREALSSGVAVAYARLWQDRCDAFGGARSLLSLSPVLPVARHVPFHHERGGSPLRIEVEGVAVGSHE